MKTIIIIGFILFSGIIIKAQTWSTDFVGIDSLWNPLGGRGEVYTMHNYKDSILFIGGNFKNVNNELDVYSIIGWNGDTITRYENGLDQWAVVSDVYYYKDKLYVGDYFLSASGHPNTQNLAIWNGTTWEGTSLGQPTSDVYEFAEFQGNMVVGGNFEHFGTTPFGRIALFDGTNWYNIGYFGMWIKALAEFNGELYAGGYSGVRRYLGGTSWEYLPIQPNEFIFEFQVDTFNTFLYVGGQFTYIGSEISHAVAMWDGFKWKAMGDFCGATVFPQAAVIYKGDLFVGGGYLYDDINDEYHIWINRWNGEQWDSIGGDFSSAITAMEIFRDTIYIGGTFDTFNGARSKGLVKLAMPDNGCDYIKPRINTLADTFYLSSSQAEVQFYNNNPYVDSWLWDFGDSETDNVKDPVHIYTDTGIYNVSLMVTHGACTKTVNRTIIVENNTGSNDINFGKFDLKLYPNPSDGNFYAEIKGFDREKSIELKIIGLNGHLKTTIHVISEKTLINTGSWAKETYICNLVMDGKMIKTEKIIIQ